MDSYFFLTIFVVAILGFFVLCRKLIFHGENKDVVDSFSSSSSSLALIETPSPYALSRNWIYDVFLSFCGADVRQNLVSDIRKSLESKGISVFNDQKEIEKGEVIHSELKRAIKGSKIAVVLISENYASSTWCLNELVEIMKCRKDFGQIVITVFYQLYPTNVRKQTGEFGKVFRETLADQEKDQTETWRLALKVLASIAGYDSSEWETDAAMIEDIVYNVSRKLGRFTRTSINYNNLVGMRTHFEKISPMLFHGLEDVKIIGIVGQNGIGKSTLTKALFDQFSLQFEGSVLIEDIRELYRKPACSGLIYENDGVVNLAVERKRLRDKNVLVVIDNVTISRELADIVKETKLFGPGSRVIVALEDKELLNEGRIDHVYEMSRPSDSEAREIFSLSAFGQHYPKDGFEDLTKIICNAVYKVPKALKSIGSHLWGKSKQQWIEEIEYLKYSSSPLAKALPYKEKIE